MSISYFQEKFKNQSDIELLEKVNNPDGYQEDTVIASINILTERGIVLSQEQLAIKLDKETKESQSKTEISQKEVSLGKSRFVAFVIDLLVLSAISFAIGLILMYLSLANDFITLGTSAILIIGYFALGNSELFVGSTIGKRQMNLTVVDAENNLISLKKSLFRSLLLLGPFFLFDFISKLESDSTVLYIVTSTLTISYYIAIVYYFLIDKNLRRSYHDIIKGTIVIQNKSSQKIEVFPRKYSLYFVGIVAIVLTINLAINYTLLNSDSSFNEETIEQLQATLDNNSEVLTQIVEEIDQIANIAKINGVKINTTNNSQTDFIIDVQSKINPSGSEGDILADKIYHSLGGKTLQVERLDNIKIILRYGFTMTLAKYNSEKTKTYEP